MRTVLITGGTGMIGKALTELLLQKNYRVIILSRSGAHNPLQAGNLSYAKWDIDKNTIDREAIASADYIIHLAGANVGDKRWTKKRKQEIIDSRVKSGELLVKTLQENANKVKAVISSSAIGWYGADADIPEPKPFIETDPPVKTFLSEACCKWEESLEPLKTIGRRLVIFRTGVVLSNNGGALAEFKKPARFGLATILGNGKQVISWIHIGDVARLYYEAIENENLQGVYNAVAPQPVTNRELTIRLAEKMKGRFFMPVHIPSLVLKIIFGELSIEVLKSTTVSCEKIKQGGFIFSFPDIDSALQDLIR